MVFERKIYDELLQWKRCEGASALLIEGASRVGKTTIVKEFAQNEYESVVYIDFSGDCDVYKDLLENYLYDMDKMFMHLRIILNDPLPERKTVIIFDEVQNFPLARSCIKHLVKDGRYDYIETGSLISIKENVKNILIPSEEHSVRMYPMDFEEFCWALGETPIISHIRDCYDRQCPLNEGLHTRAMHLFMEYLLVGGMPQCVEAYASDRKKLDVDDIKAEILREYQDSMAKASSHYRSKVLGIYDSLPSSLSLSGKKIVYNKFGKGACTEDYEDAFFWLADSMMCNISVNCRHPDLGLMMSDKRKCVKCYMGDTGLLLAHATADDSQKKHDIQTQILNKNFCVDNGMLYENAVAQMLASSGHPLFHYFHYSPEKHKKDAEADFLIKDRQSIDGKLCPIAVKTTSKYTTTLLKNFKKMYGDTISRCIVIHPENMRSEDDTMFLPPYMIFCL